MTVDITWLVFAVCIVCVLLLVFSGKLTNGRVAEFWLDFSVVMVLSGMMILLLPESDADITVRMVLLCGMWYIIGKRYAHVIEGSKS